MWYFILSLVLAIYFLINIILTNILSGIIGTYLMRSLLFISLAICVFFISKNEDPDYYPVYEDEIMGKAVFHVPKIGWFQIIVREFFNILSKPFKS